MAWQSQRAKVTHLLRQLPQAAKSGSCSPPALQQLHLPPGLPVRQQVLHVPPCQHTALPLPQCHTKHPALVVAAGQHQLLLLLLLLLKTLLPVAPTNPAVQHLAMIYQMPQQQL